MSSINVNAGYEIRHDESFRLIEAELWGFWTIDIYNSYAKELSQLVHSYQKRGVACSMLSIMDRLGVQSSQITDYFGKQLQAPAPKDFRVAMVMESALLRLQVQRLLANDNQKVFATREEAVIWLSTF